MRDAIIVNGKELNIELELPQLNDSHDEMAVRISGLSPEVDPEKLKFYVAAIANRAVTDLTFDRARTKAVVRFSEEIS